MIDPDDQEAMARRSKRRAAMKGQTCRFCGSKLMVNECGDGVCLPCFHKNREEDQKEKEMPTDIVKASQFSLAPTTSGRPVSACSGRNSKIRGSGGGEGE